MLHKDKQGDEQSVLPLHPLSQDMTDMHTTPCGRLDAQTNPHEKIKPTDAKHKTTSHPYQSGHLNEPILCTKPHRSSLYPH
mmetsp:Transcript_29890/g.86694  ORF Transcript_29890/g.86694 Transcript_29890/m.86694 type:complete len:81 (+) Transcript_29890:1478-1720(+)